MISPARVVRKIVSGHYPKVESGAAVSAMALGSARLMASVFTSTVYAMEKDRKQHEKIDGEMRNIIEEARVILPGVQALFGFQTIAVFNQRFTELANFAKVCHVIGLAMVIITVAMVMTPAIYYRASGGNATVSMAKLSSAMIRGALVPLAIGLSLDMFTVIEVATGRLDVSLIAAIGTFVLLTGLWFVLPMRGRKKSRECGED
jgi:hypothetical protein